MMTNDELDAVLTPKPATPDAVRQALVYQSTLAALPRAVPRTTAFWRGGVVTGVFALGGLTGWLAKPVPAPVIEERILEVPAILPAVPPSMTTTESVAVQSPYRLTPSELDQLESEAELAEPPAAAKLYRRVADAYLAKSDVIAATRCYRLHLNELGRDGLARHDDDSWLLVSLKSSTRQEMDR